MRTTQKAFIIGLFSSLTIFCGLVRSQDIGDCNYTPSGIASWKSLIQRQLAINDSENAARLTKISSDILDGEYKKLAADLAGASVEYPLKLAGGDMSLLELSVAACQPEIAKYLVDLGASVNGLESSAPLVIAAAKGQDELAEFLIQRGARVDKPDENGMTALEAAIRLRKIGATRVLLKYGSDPNQRLAGGATLLDLVRNSTDSVDRDIVAELEKKGAVSGRLAK